MTIETKYNVNQDWLFIMHENKVKQCHNVESIDVFVDYNPQIKGGRVKIVYNLRIGSSVIKVDENKIFSSKEELLKSL